MTSEIMRRAHELAKQMVGDYQARLVLGLRQAWQESRKPEPLSLEEQVDAIIAELQSAGIVAKPHFDWTYDSCEIHVIRKLSRGWQRMGTITVDGDGEVEVVADRRGATIKECVAKAVA